MAERTRRRSAAGSSIPKAQYWNPYTHTRLRTELGICIRVGVYYVGISVYGGCVGHRHKRTGKPAHAYGIQMYTAKA
eukprot:1079240-Rhodomonas_salina.2